MMKSEQSLVKMRDSNMELLRIMAMFLVLVVHADYYSLGAPSSTELQIEPLPSVTRIFFQILGVGASNLFILISGYYGIHPSLKGFYKFAFQILFFSIGIYLVFLLVGLAPLTLTGIRETFYLSRFDWFIKSFIVLYLFSPVLNAFVENVDKKTFASILLAFFTFQTIYGWLYSTCAFFNDGYSAISLMGIYLLARYLRFYPNRFWEITRWKHNLVMFLVCIIINLSLEVAAVALDSDALHTRIAISYTNPFTIIAGVYVLLLFASLKFCSKLINWVALSAFAVLLFHLNYHVIGYYKLLIKTIYNSYSGVSCLSFLVLILGGVFLICVIADKARIFIWERLNGIKFELWKKNH